ncbi:uncharacterized protein LOC143037417 [Oratosquilla oratoria]|uniref:uncharacterized protein LOC143037417 n=1 Tax=Oratosquilla oratoria TaxID=337810 RepID=UPI003F7572AF
MHPKTPLSIASGRKNHRDLETRLAVLLAVASSAGSSSGCSGCSSGGGGGGGGGSGGGGGGVGCSLADPMGSVVGEGEIMPCGDTMNVENAINKYLTLDEQQLLLDIRRKKAQLLHEIQVSVTYSA